MFPPSECHHRVEGRWCVALATVKCALLLVPMSWGGNQLSQPTPLQNSEDPSITQMYCTSYTIESVLISGVLISAVS